MSLIKPRHVAVLIGIALVGSTQTTVGGTPPQPVVIRQAPRGVSASVQDLTAKDGMVVVGWSELDGHTVDARFAASTDAGDNYLAGSPTEGHTGSRVDACPGGGVVALTGYLGANGRRAIELIGSETDPRKIEEAGTDYLQPDVTCVRTAGGVRYALVVLIKRKTGTRLIMWLFKPDLTDGARFGFDLGPASPGVAPVVTASAGWIHVAWMKGKSLRYKRYKVGPAPGFAVTPKPTMVIETTSDQAGPVLGVDGKRVVLAWRRKASVVVRVSTDRGASFRARRTLMRGSPATGKVGFATNADAQGSTLMVSGTMAGEGIVDEGRVMVSTDGGRTWTDRVATLGSRGFIFAALDTAGSATRIHWTVDWRLADPTKDGHTLQMFRSDQP